VLVAVGLLVVSVGSAAAHSELVSSSPADGARLVTAPATVELTFNEPVSDVGLQVVARGPVGIVELPPAQVVGTQVITEWPQSAPPGEYVVSYRVVSADGHPIDGTLAMTIESDTTSGTSADVGQSAIAAEPSPIAAEAATDGGFPWWIAVVAVIGGVGIGAGIARGMRRRGSA
jgi:copper resistance protein C